MTVNGVLEELCDLVCKYIKSGSAIVCRDHDRKIVYIWIGVDVFLLEDVDSDAIVMRYQNVQCIIIRGASHWAEFSRCFLRAEINDEMIYSARKSVASAVVDRIQNIDPDKVK